MNQIAMPARLRTQFSNTLGLALLGLTPVASGQAIPNAGQVLESMEQRRPTLPAPAALDLRLPETAVPAPAGDGEAIAVRSFAIEGNTAIATDELLDLLAPLAGKSLTLAELEAGAARITQRYRERGYPFAHAYLPAQAMSDGRLRIAVLEGRIGEVKLTNASRQKSTVLAAPLARLRSGDPLRSDALENSLLLLGDVAGVRAQATLQPGVATGTSDLVVEAEDMPLTSGTLGLDNAGNRYTGTYRLSGHLQLRGALGLGEQIQLQTLLTNEDLYNYRLAYQMPAGAWSTRVGASLSYLDYALDQEFGMLNAYGTAKVASIHAIQPLLRSRGANLNARLQYDQKRLTNHVGLFGSHERKRSHLVTLGLDGNWQDTLGGQAVNQWGLAWVHGQLRLPSVAQQQRDDLSARSAGSFQVLTANLARWQALGGPWRLHGRINGQWSSKNLDSSEKMSLGGAYGVRAYPQDEASGDQGLLAALELHYALTDYWQLSGFVDGGRVQLQHRPWAAGHNHRSLKGAGFGLQRNTSDWLLESSLAWRLGGMPATSMPDKKPRLWVKAQKQF